MIDLDNKDRRLAYPVDQLVNALNNYDLLKRQLNERLTRVESSKEIYDIEQQEAAALQQVREAFYEATKDRNSMESCMRIDVDFARRIAKYAQETGIKTDDQEHPENCSDDLSQSFRDIG